MFDFVFLKFIYFIVFLAKRWSFDSGNSCDVTPSKPGSASAFDLKFLQQAEHRIVKRECPAHVCRDARYRTLYYRRFTKTRMHT